MRKLMWFSLGFALAAVLCAWIAPGFWCVFTGGGALLLSLLPIFWRRNGKRRIIARCLSLGLGLGLIWCLFYDGVLLRPARLADGTVREIQVELCDEPRETLYGGAVEGYTSLEGKRYKILLYLDEYLPELKPGDQITIPAELRLTTEGGKQEPTYHRSQGIFLLAYPRGEMEIQKAGMVPARYGPVLWRRWMENQITACFSPDSQGFLKALLLGNKEDLDFRTRNDLSIAGLAHIVAVSGLHVAMLFGLVYRLAGKRRILTALLGIPVVLGFAAVAGFSPSVTRAAIMEILIMLAAVFDREYDPPTALAMAALLILAANPRAVTAVGFQLSFGAVAGIFLFSQRLQSGLLRRLGAGKGRNLRARLLRFAVGSISLTLSASVFTTPLIAYYFGNVSLLAPLTNLLALWIVSAVFPAAILGCLLGGIWLPLGKLIGIPCAWGVRIILGIVSSAAKFPLCAVYTQSLYTVLWLIFSYLLFLAFLWGKRKRLKLLAVTVAFALCVSMLAAWIEPLTDQFRVTVLDVGQGQCILLQSGKHTFVVDCGGSDPDRAGEEAARCLLSMGICRVDGLIFTHLDLDHGGGGPQLLSRISAARVFYPAQEREERIEPLWKYAGKAELTPVAENMEITFPQGKIQIFAPIAENSGNRGSLAILFTGGNCDTLITGDMDAAQERQLLEREPLPDLEIWIVGHHGSKYASSPELLAKLCPEIAVISVGRNSFGHPAAETLARLTDFGCEIHRTDEEGTIIIRG